MTPQPSHGGQGPDAPAGTPTCGSGPSPALTSQQLMQGQKAVAITHNGTTYRLQATRQGKLILTK